MLYAMAEITRSTTAVDPRHLKVKTYNQNLLHHYPQSKNQLNSYIILRIQQILGSHQLKDHDHFLPHSPKNHWINF